MTLAGLLAQVPHPVKPTPPPAHHPIHVSGTAVSYLVVLAIGIGLGWVACRAADEYGDVVKRWIEVGLMTLGAGLVVFLVGHFALHVF